jgi:hypothetical protein
MTLIPEQYLYSICEVKTMNNMLLESGRIYQIEDDSIRVVNPGDKMSILKFGTRVKVNVYNHNLSFLSLVGTIYISTPEFMDIREICSLAEAEKRSFFRVSTDFPAVVKYLSHATNETLQADVHVENVSLCGLLFSGDLKLKVYETVDIKLLLPIGNLDFKCKVMRIETNDVALPKYGCEFFDAEEKQIDILWVYILQRQSEEIRSKKRAREL